MKFARVWASLSILICTKVAQFAPIHPKIPQRKYKIKVTREKREVEGIGEKKGTQTGAAHGSSFNNDCSQADGLPYTNWQ